jgi:nucleoside phosphorylase
MHDGDAALHPEHVDFLIVTAVKDEFNAVKANVLNPVPKGLDTLADIPRIDSTQPYRISVIVTGQTNVVAQGKVKDAISRRKPRAVILVGIAAGFRESDVDLGDILVPFYIAPYEHTKISEQPAEHTSSLSQPTAGPPQLRFQHREFPTEVDEPLWDQAEALSRDSHHPWLVKIREPRPHARKAEPTIHADRRFILGSGEKLVASEFVECRDWLIRESSKNGKTAVGLEMEAYGVLRACRSENVPLLVVKAAQDPGTKDKNDEWRGYSTSAAAAFAVTFIERCLLKADYRGPAETEVSTISDCFVPAEDAFRASIERNFLFEFD